ncbi:meso-diaminopimelate D-dehydrogenase [Sporosarcina sp. NCCP-2716]|uniref:diaminopimelate dehydrogenase n=1 Tax=Sporosarcina sp. NCCP-2716 TaxID=2943679 RepID=UPI0020403DFC|nr:diaminopimelate dehydrogenase [Sporosarcina sp. NCCP-2716]GKV68940.1 meso-diaminopimelate D-dehydrogenase [Sporosarcina sp. NCCP-2716]
MENVIRVGIAGYGNLGRGVEYAIAQQPDMRCAGIFTRRNPEDVRPVSAEVPVLPMDTIQDYAEDIDVMILCGGSRSDLPEQGPQLAKWFTTVDSFDTHAKIPEYYDALNEAAAAAGTTAVLSVGWDPGLFSLNRLYGETVLADGATYTFWGKGLSQGHSDAVRRVPGVAQAVQYTIPSEDAMAKVRAGEEPELTTGEKHTRECYVVLEEGADKEEIRTAICTMPDYFADYSTAVHFISSDELERDHSSMPHGGFVIRSGKTGEGSRQVMEYSLTLDSNPEFTSSVLTAYARAAYKLAAAGQHGAKTVFDIAPGLLSPKDPAQLRKELL